MHASVHKLQIRTYAYMYVHTCCVDIAWLAGWPEGRCVLAFHKSCRPKGEQQLIDFTQWPATLICIWGPAIKSAKSPLPPCGTRFCSGVARCRPNKKTTSVWASAFCLHSNCPVMMANELGTLKAIINTNYFRAALNQIHSCAKTEMKAIRW